MKKNLIVRLVLVVLGVLLGFLLPIQSASAGVTVKWQSKIVYVEDHANDSWPVWAAAENLDRMTDMDLRVGTQCPVRTGVQCLKVYSVSNISGAAIGVTTRSYSARTGYLSSVTSKVENSFGNRVTYAQRLALLCHEIGHGVGLPHGGGCMDGSVGRGTPTTISSTHVRLINGWY